MISHTHNSNSKGSLCFYVQDNEQENDGDEIGNPSVGLTREHGHCCPLASLASFLFPVLGNKLVSLFFSGPRQDAALPCIKEETSTTPANGGENSTASADACPLGPKL